MPISLDISSNAREVSRHLKRVQRDQVPFAASKAVNRLGNALVGAGRSAGKGELLRQWRRDTDTKAGGNLFAKANLDYRRSNKRQAVIEARISNTPRIQRMMRKQIDGGTFGPERGKYLIVPKSSKAVTGKGRGKRKLSASAAKGLRGEAGNQSLSEGRNRVLVRRTGGRKSTTGEVILTLAQSITTRPRFRPEQAVARVRRKARRVMAAEMAKALRTARAPR